MPFHETDAFYTVLGLLVLATGYAAAIALLGVVVGRHNRARHVRSRRNGGAWPDLE